MSKKTTTISQNKLLEHGSTILLRISIYAIGAAVLALCLFALPPGIVSDEVGYYRPILVGLYVPAIPFFIALFQSLKLLNLIDNKKTFSRMSLDALKNIKYCAIVISSLFTLGLPYIYYAANRDDAPGVLAIALVIIGASISIGVFASVLQRLLQNAIEYKSENDLTV